MSSKQTCKESWLHHHTATSPSHMFMQRFSAAETTEAWSALEVAPLAQPLFYLSVFCNVWGLFTSSPHALPIIPTPQLDIVQQEYIHEAGLSQFEVVRAAFDCPGDWLATVEQRQQTDAELELNLKLWAFDQQTQRCRRHTFHRGCFMLPHPPHTHPQPTNFLSYFHYFLRMVYWLLWH